MRKNIFFTPLICIFLLLIYMASCNRQGVVRSLEQENLFSISYGNFEDEINLFDLAEVGNVATTHAMQDGFFYVANGASKKILEMNSYGDILSIYYSSEENGGNMAHLDSREGIKTEIPYPVDFSSSLAIDTQKNIYLAATLPKDRHERDEELNLLNSQVVLVFAENGANIDYLGQQGLGGTPFPFIRHISTTAKDEIVVLCTTNTGSMAYWFSKTGFLMYKIPLETSAIPMIENATDLTIENAFPDYYKNILYVKVDYYTPHIDRDVNTQTGIDFLATMLYPLHIDTSSYGKPTNIPAYEQTVDDSFSKTSYELPYDYIGTTKSGWHFFILATNDGFIVEMMQPETQRVLRRQFQMPRKDILHYTFSLSDTGIISGLFSTKEKTSILWWRTDELIDSILKN